jgi:hypothetical protein
MASLYVRHVLDHDLLLSTSGKVKETCVVSKENVTKVGAMAKSRE